MPYGYSDRTKALLVVLLLVVAGGVVVSRAFRGALGDSRACPRSLPATEMTARMLWEGATGTMGPAPEVMRSNPDDLRPLADPDDAEACRRLRELLPDTLKAGLLGPNSMAFYRVGEIYVVPVVPNPSRSEIEAMERGDFSAERSGTTYVFDREFRLLATYPN